MKSGEAIVSPDTIITAELLAGLGGGKYTDSYYLRYDPFAGDRDTDVKMKTVTLVKVRKERECWMGLGPDSKPHKINVGQRARHERALVDGEWCGYYVCLPCIDSWLKDVCGEPPNLSEEPVSDEVYNAVMGSKGSAL